MKPPMKGTSLKLWGATKSSSVREQSQQSSLSKAKYTHLVWSAWGHELDGKKKCNWGTIYMLGRETRKNSSHGQWITAAKREMSPVRTSSSYLARSQCVGVGEGGGEGGRVVFNWGTCAIVGIRRWQKTMNHFKLPLPLMTYRNVMFFRRTR